MTLPLHALAARLSRIVVGLALALTLAHSSEPTDAQQQSGTSSEQVDVIRITTNLVQVRATVTDRTGKLVDDLKQDDFEVLENDQAQKISFFSKQTSNGRASSFGQERARTYTNEVKESSTNSPPSRSIVIFVDTLHLSNLSLTHAKQQLKQFVGEQVSDQDVVAVVTPSGELGVLQQFMRDHKMMVYAIDRITGLRKQPSLFTPYLAAKVLQQTMSRPPNLNAGIGDGGMPRSSINSPGNLGGNPADDAIQVATEIMSGEGDLSDVRMRAREILSEDAMLRSATLKTLQATCQQMSAMPGQRLLMLLSDGFTLLTEGGGGDHDDFMKAISHAVRAGVVMYSFSPQGLTAPVEFTAASPVHFNSTQRNLYAAYGGLMAETRMDQQSNLKILAADTGGEAYLNSNDVVGQFRKMLDANRIIYALAYYPENKSDKFRSIKVLIRNHPDYRVRTQKGYMPLVESKNEGATTPQQKLFQAMMSPLPLSAIMVTSSASFLKRDTDDATASVQVHFDGTSFNYGEGDPKRLDCEVVVAVVDRSGSVVSSSSETVSGTFTLDQLHRAKAQGYRYAKRLVLDPGLYQIRIGVRDINSAVMGTSSSWVTVSNLTNKTIVLSSLFLGRQNDTGQTEGATTGNNRASSPSLIIGPASFRPTDTVSYRFVVYGLSANSQNKTDLMMKIEIQRSGSTIYEGPSQSVDSHIIRRDRAGIEIGGQIKMNGETGPYTLLITVKDLKTTRTAQQTIDFEVQ